MQQGRLDHSKEAKFKAAKTLVDLDRKSASNKTLVSALNIQEPVVMLPKQLNLEVLTCDVLLTLKSSYSFQEIEIIGE